MTWSCVYNSSAYLSGSSGGIDSGSTGTNGTFADQMTALNAATASGDLITLEVAYTGNVAFTVQSGWNTAILANAGNTDDVATTAIRSAAIFWTVKGASALPDINFPRTGGSTYLANINARRPTASGTITLGPTSSNTLSSTSTTATTGSLTTIADSAVVVVLASWASPPSASALTATTPSTYIARLNSTTSASDIWQLRKRIVPANSPQVRTNTGDAFKTGAGATGTISAAGNGSSANLHTLVAASFYVEPPVHVTTSGASLTATSSLTSGSASGSGAILTVTSSLTIGTATTLPAGTAAGKSFSVSVSLVGVIASGTRVFTTATRVQGPTRLPSAPEEYDQEFMARLVGLVDQYLAQENSRKRILGTTMNISMLPTSATGLRSGDIWSDSGVLTVVT